MGRPNRIHSEPFQDLEAALPNAQRNGCSKRAAIVVQANSLILKLRPLSQKPVAASKRNSRMPNGTVSSSTTDPATITFTAT